VVWPGALTETETGSTISTFILPETLGLLLDVAVIVTGKFDAYSTGEGAV
jgi:hypothetical protein